MTSKLRNLTLPLCLVSALTCVVFAGQRVHVARDAPEKSFTSALRESVPPVNIYAKHAIFSRIVRIEAVESLNAEGHPTTAPAVLRSIGSGLAIDTNGRAVRIDADDLLALDDWIIGGVAENAGNHPLRITFDDGREMTLQPGEVFYVGTYERLLRPDQIPGANGAVAGLVDPVILGPGSHCYVCECQCGVGPGGCVITVDTTASADCAGVNGTRCQCSEGGGGSTSGCTKVLVPCNPNAAQ